MQPRRFQLQPGKLVPGPFQSVADVGHGAVDDIDLGAQPVVNADGKKTVIEQVPSLLPTNVFPGEHYVTTAVYHEG